MVESVIIYPMISVLLFVVIASAAYAVYIAERNKRRAADRNMPLALSDTFTGSLWWTKRNFTFPLYLLVIHLYK